ncbi:MAG: hypothetical protein R3C05_28780 [Pirellulaceae bacterium]
MPSNGGNNPGGLQFGEQQLAPPEPEPVPTDYLYHAKLAFAAGMEERAYELLLAHLVVEPELAKASQSYDFVGFSSLARKPTWGLRLGIAVNTATVKHEGEMHPIRQNMKEPKEAVAARAPRGGRGASAGGGEAAGGGDMGAMPMMESGMGQAGSDLSGPHGEIDRYVGLVGTVALDLYEQSFKRGDFGRVFATVQAGDLMPGGSAGGQPGAGRPGAQMASGEMMDEAAMNAVANEGSGAMVAPGMSAAGVRTATEGAAMAGVAPTEFDMVGAGAMNAGGAEMMAPAAPGANLNGLGFGGLGGDSNRIRPGLFYLGTGRADELLEKAQEEGLDAFLRIDVSVNKNAVNGWVYNESGVRWISTATGQSLGRPSKKLDNRAVFQAMESKDADPEQIVREELAAVFGSGMDDWKLNPFPELTPAAAMTRVGRLIKDTPENPLEALAEIRLYEAKGLLTEDQVHTAFDMIMGDRGLILAAGPADRREELLEPMVPKLTSL